MGYVKQNIKAGNDNVYAFFIWKFKKQTVADECDPNQDQHER